MRFICDVRTFHMADGLRSAVWEALVEELRGTPGLTIRGDLFVDEVPAPPELLRAIERIDSHRTALGATMPSITDEVWDTVRVAGLHVVSLLVEDSTGGDVLSAVDGGSVITRGLDTVDAVERLRAQLTRFGVSEDQWSVVDLEDDGG